MKNCDRKGKITDICKRLYAYARLDDRMDGLEERMTDLESFIEKTKNTNSYFSLEIIAMKMKVLYDVFSSAQVGDINKRCDKLMKEIDANSEQVKKDFPPINDIDED